MQYKYIFQVTDYLLPNNRALVKKNSIWTRQPHKGAVPSTASPTKAVWLEDDV